MNLINERDNINPEWSVLQNILDKIMIISEPAINYKLLTTEDDNSINVNTFQNLFNKEMCS